MSNKLPLSRALVLNTLAVAISVALNAHAHAAGEGVRAGQAGDQREVKNW